ncbi:MAG: hypothetical protein NUV31_09715 [Dehalococcoidales bacterium]|nr:hypothetical protein [Dehalococcoidales bacterium]
MSNWKDEDIATPDLIKEYLKEFEAGMQENPRYQLSEGEKLKVRESLDATEKFCLGILSGKKRMYMHDLILMAVGYYGGYLTALDALKKQG